jgi:hypothetical protein
MEVQLPLSVQPFINAYLDAIQALRTHFYGIYIFGSLALGAFEEQKSDIDILALIQGEWTGHQLAQLKHIHTQLIQMYPLGKRLEVLYVPLHDLGKSDTDVAPYPYCGRKGKFHAAGYYGLNAVIWWIIKYKAICLYGPECSALPLEVTWRAVLEEMRDYLDTYLTDKAKHPYLFLLDGWIWEVVPTLCRTLTILEDSEISTKPLALKRWRDRLPALWHPLIDEAWRIGYHPHTPSLYRSPIKRMREMLAFIEYTRERGHKVLATSLESKTEKIY